MKGWQIGVLVVMCVVFVAAAAVLCFLIYRFWGGLSGGAVEEGEDNESRKDTSRRECRGERYYLDGGAADDVVRVSDGSHFHHLHLKKSGHILHYLDLQRQPKTVDLKSLHDIATGADLQKHLSRVENMDDPDTLGLTYINQNNELIDMDLDQLIRRDDGFAKRMQHTADRPLLLGRLTEMIEGGLSVTPSAPSAAAAPFNPFQGASRDVNVGVDVAQTRQLSHALAPAVSPAVPPSNIFRPPPVHDALGMKWDTEPATAVGAVTGATGEAASSLPVPIIFPSRRASSTRMTTQTPVFILAARYVVQAHHSTPGAPVPLVDDTTVAALERSMAGELERSFYLDHGAFAHHIATVNPERGTALLQHPSGARYELARCAAPVVKYSVDRTTSAQWSVFTGPFYLPPGRWCVRAKSCTQGDEASSAVVAKVYTVNVV